MYDFNEKLTTVVVCGAFVTAIVAIAYAEKKYSAIKNTQTIRQNILIGAVAKSR